MSRRFIIFVKPALHLVLAHATADAPDVLAEMDAPGGQRRQLRSFHLRVTK